jgi:DNA adenine methylase
LLKESLIKKIKVAPFLKWVGGKRQLMSTILQHLPDKMEDLQYIEPFIGGGAVLFHLQPKRVIINDFNAELVNVYKVVRDDVEALIAHLKNHKNEVEYFYKIRELDRNPGLENLSDVERASRILFLNKTCFNGLYRVNKAGYFNVPFGRYKTPNFINESTLRADSQYLNQANIEILNLDFAEVLEKTDDKSFVYLDPPYQPVSKSSNFTGYVQGGWDETEQIRLRECCDLLHAKGVKFLLSNSSAKFITDQYRNYNIKLVKANRAINSVGSQRGEVDEVLIWNY